MVGILTHETEANVPASDAWALFGSLKLSEVVSRELPHQFTKVEIIQGDGGIDTILKISFPPETPGFTYHIEKYVKIDNEKRIKEAKVIEGGYLNLGFTSYLIRLEIIEKEADSCIIKATVEYDIDEDAVVDESIINIDLVATKELPIKGTVTKKLLFKSGLEYLCYIYDA